MSSWGIEPPQRIELDEPGSQQRVSSPPKRQVEAEWASSSNEIPNEIPNKISNEHEQLLASARPAARPDVLSDWLGSVESENRDGTNRQASGAMTSRGKVGESAQRAALRSENEWGRQDAALAALAGLLAMTALIWVGVRIHPQRK